MKAHVDNNVFTTIEIVLNLPNRLESSQWTAFMRAHTQFLADDSIEWLTLFDGSKQIILFKPFTHTEQTL